MILMFLVLLSSLSLTSCGSGINILNKKLEKMGFVENPHDALTEVRDALAGYHADCDYYIAKGSTPRLWQKGDEMVIVFECKDMDTLTSILFNTSFKDNINGVKIQMSLGRVYQRCLILSAPDYVYSEIARMNGFYK